MSLCQVINFWHLKNKLKNMRKVLIIDPVGSKAGMDYYDLQLVNGLKSNGIDAQVISNFNAPRVKKIFIGHSDNKFRKAFNYIYGIFIGLLYSLKINIRTVLFHSFSMGIKDLIPLLLSKILFRNVILIVHDVSSFVGEDNEMLRGIILNNLADTLIVHNEFSKNRLIEFLKPKELSKVKIINHGGFISLTSEVSKEEARIKLSLDQDKKYVLFFGQIKQVKGLDILIKAFGYCEINDCELIIAGKPWKDDFNKYDELLEKVGVKTNVNKIIRFIEDEERDLLFKAVDLLVLPYREIYQSGVLLMAMSYGLPVLCSDLPANKEVINQDNGILFRTEDEKDLAQKIMLIFNDSNKNMLISIGKKAKETIEIHYDWANITKAYLEFI